MGWLISLQNRGQANLRGKRKAFMLGELRIGYFVAVPGFPTGQVGRKKRRNWGERGVALGIMATLQSLGHQNIGDRRIEKQSSVADSAPVGRMGRWRSIDENLREKIKGKEMGLTLSAVGLKEATTIDFCSRPNRGSGRPLKPFYGKAIRTRGLSERKITIDISVGANGQRFTHYNQKRTRPRLSSATLNISITLWKKNP